MAYISCLKYCFAANSLTPNFHEKQIKSSQFLRLLGVKSSVQFLDSIAKTRVSNF